MNAPRPRPNLLSRLAAAFVLASFAFASAAQEREQVERRVQSVGTLIERSSAAKQIESSGVAAARERRDNARLIHREAVAALATGDAAGASKLLDQAAREMMDGARLARPEQVAGEKHQRDFEARLESARALLAAQGRYEEARPVLDRAYLTARVSIESMRRGDTLVRSLNFASPREEYDYEVDRNDTHAMLIKVLLADRKDMAGTLAPFTDKAAALRRDAEAKARTGDHAAGIRLLEDSTRELVRAIRSGGIYIPG